jgi:hypothetical protein
MSTDQFPRKKLIFVSYSRADNNWLKRLRPHLSALAREGTTEFWIDESRLKPGEVWREELERAIETADEAILLVSNAYISSDFIWNEELPALQKIHERGGRLLVLKTEPCTLPAPLLNQLHMVDSRHLEGMSKKEYKLVFQNLMEVVREVSFASAPTVAQEQPAPSLYDIFLAVPMISAKGPVRAEIHAIGGAMLRAFESCGFRVYCARSFEDSDEYEDNEETDIPQAALETLSKLKQIKKFVMLYPAEIASSVLMESGFTIALETPSVYFIHIAAPIPYMLGVAKETMPFVHIHRYSCAEDIVRIIKKNRSTLFNAYAS